MYVNIQIMSSHFKWYPAGEEVVVPWNARYSFPSQANKAIKITPRIPPKNGAIFTPGNVIRVEFPAQGYVNPANTHLVFDVTLINGNATAANGNCVRFQNNIQSIFSRIRLLYGSTPLEDIIDYNQIVRNMTEWAATAGSVCDQTSIAEGMGGVTMGKIGTTPTLGLVNVRQQFIQGIDNNTGAAAAFGNVTPNNTTVNGSINTTRRYQIQFALGLFTQSKLIPTKFMASQLAIELTLASPTNCLFTTATTGVWTTQPSYSVSNINLIPEILEFDASYDATFIRGLREGGVPIKFSSWHTYQFSASSTLNCLIQERSRSVKALIAVCRRNQGNIYADSGATLFTPTHNTTLVQYQYRCGGRYFPASPVQTSLSIGSSTIPNGGAEAFVELQKVLNTVGDYRLETAVNALRWGQGIGLTDGSSTVVNEGELDYIREFGGYDAAGNATTIPIYSATNSLAGNMGSACFAMCTSLETSNGLEISGLNAEEQSDISLQALYAGNPFTNTAYNIEVFTYYDAMLVLRENNVLELIQ